ncbi:eaa51e90-dbcd-443b-9c8e-412e7028b503 [Sclerotinia trifoliorum]|uniref:Eaa51e90-dbcd-443b-9c8e-412e7028b503 n=1 Tax=Sclerotinia trifoliorum TaxID=28548 RepID=A0A8H2ZP27_9HELO|nr:eaa51e90-dbcd-443b-9c8e-412e7028b503 [Sclerotinia trifoliorum]
MSEDKILELQRFKASQDLIRARQSSKKRQYGLLKKAEQLRKVAKLDVAMIIFDPDSQQYCIYRSKDDDSWPPPIMEIKNLSISINYLPGDFEVKDSNATSVDEDPCPGKKRRNKIPDISLKRKKAKTENFDAGHGSNPSPQHHEKTEISHETSLVTPRSFVEELDESVQDTPPASMMLEGQFGSLDIRNRLDSPDCAGVGQSHQLSPALGSSCKASDNSSCRLLSAVVAPEGELDYFTQDPPYPMSHVSLCRSSSDLNSSEPYSTLREQELKDSLSLPPIPDLPEFLRSRHLIRRHD